MIYLPIISCIPLVMRLSARANLIVDRPPDPYNRMNTQYRALTNLGPVPEGLLARLYMKYSFYCGELGGGGFALRASYCVK